MVSMVWLCVCVCWGWEDNDGAWRGGRAVTVLVLGTTTEFTISSHMVVAETVIVGDVPETYLKTGG